MKKYFISLTLILLTLTILTACGGPSIKNESEIGKDLIAGDYLSGNNINYIIDDVEIAKRQTDVNNKSDTIYATITATSEDNLSKLTGEYKIEYGLYNEGWLIDDVTVSDVSVLPLQGKEFTTEELIEAMASCNYHNIAYLSVFDYQENLEEGLIHYSISAEDVCTYATEYIDATLSFSFDAEQGWQPWNCTITINHSVCDWDIAGEYYCESDKLRDNLVIYDEEPSEHISMCICEPSSDYSHELESVKLYDARQDSLESIVSDASASWYKNSWFDEAHDYINDHGFYVEMRGDYSNLDAFEYATYLSTAGNRCDYILFIGKNDIYRSTEFDLDVDSYNGRVLLDIWKMVPVD